MRRIACPALVALLAAPPAAAADLSFPIERFRLDNGLEVLLHQDPSSPRVAVNLMYRVGSRDEEPGRTGFAHLFEHLMFMGTSRVPRGQFDGLMEAEGAWNNAWTGEDLTDYFDVGPSHTLPLLLWLEGDRLSALGPHIDAEKLGLQRDVVRNERRQSYEDEPYGVADLVMPEMLFPLQHPYHHTVIGSHADLEAAKVEDVRAFFAKYYVPANATLVIAGDFDAEQARAWAKQYLGWIGGSSPPPAPERPPAPWVEPLAAASETLYDDVAVPMVRFAWRSPAAMSKGDVGMDLATRAIASGRASRLYKSLVHQQQLAQSVRAMQMPCELGSSFVVEAVAREGVTAEALEAALHDEIEAIRAKGLAADEVARGRNAVRMEVVGMLESVDMRAMFLNLFEAWTGDAANLEKAISRYDAVTPDWLALLLREVLDPERRVTLRVLPKPARKAGGAKP